MQSKSENNVSKLLQLLGDFVIQTPYRGLIVPEPMNIQQPDPATPRHWYIKQAHQQTLTTECLQSEFCLFS